ncbi:hypothetical protein OG883_03390 [Streptomyces sp. NBC_01142]|uniref:hypothetical protein n=1 Tax=Streptomyces sp. NBC_01142 TaxID=2975865 RepID=UPI00225A7A54|nr:hypothetical protein [Streptomyces sp. NBC_01142]MCX4818964.1 hypothetical protein [Streptomyces sp. NBC_01142]
MTITQLISPRTVGNDAGDDVVGEGDSVAAYTELVLRDPSDVRAIQYDTASPRPTGATVSAVP